MLHELLFLLMWPNIQPKGNIGEQERDRLSSWSREMHPMVEEVEVTSYIENSMDQKPQKENECSSSLPLSPLFIQFMYTTTQKMVSPRFRVGLPFLVIFSGHTLTSMPTVYILGDPKSSQVDNGDLPSQKPPGCCLGGEKLPQILLLKDTWWRGELEVIHNGSKKLCPSNICCSSLVEFVCTKPHFFIDRWRT